MSPYSPDVNIVVMCFPDEVILRIRLSSNLPPVSQPPIIGQTDLSMASDWLVESDVCVIQERRGGIFHTHYTR